MAKSRRLKGGEKKPNGLIESKQKAGLHEEKEGGEGGLMSGEEYEKLTKGIFKRWRDEDTFRPENPLPLKNCPEDPWETNYAQWEQEEEFELDERDSVLGGNDDDIRTSDEVTQAYDDLNRRKPSANVNGFYKSFRYKNERPFRGKWGIFLNDDALHAMATRAARYLVLRKKTDEPYLYHRANALVTDVIQEHEYYHYRFDHYAKTCEHIAGRQLYQPLKDLFSRHKSRQTEESLANQTAWFVAHGSQEYDEESDFLNPGIFFYREFKRQPNAYAEFDRPPEYLRAILAAQFHDGKTDFRSQRKDLESMVAHAFFLDQFVCNRARFLPPCPVHHLQSKTKGGRIPKHLMVFL